MTRKHSQPNKLGAYVCLRVVWLGLLQTPEELLLLLLQELVGPSLVVENVEDVYSLVVENVDDVYPDPSVCEGALGARETLGFIRKRKLSSPIYPRTRSSDAKKEETKATEAALEGQVKSELQWRKRERLAGYKAANNIGTKQKKQSKVRGVLRCASYRVGLLFPLRTPFTGSAQNVNKRSARGEPLKIFERFLGW